MVRFGQRNTGGVLTSFREDTIDYNAMRTGQLGSFDDDGSQEADVGESARYEDLFGSTKKKEGNKKDNGKRKAGSSKKVKLADELLDFEMDDEQDEHEHEDGEAQNVGLSTHEKELQKSQSKVKQMEKANMEPKSWTMPGEVTAAKRPKNSALEVDLDFEHSVRPAPVITEDVVASLEDLIRKRINEVLGKDRRERTRAIGLGVSPSFLKNSSHMVNKVVDLQLQVSANDSKGVKLRKEIAQFNDFVTKEMKFCKFNGPC